MSMLVLAFLAAGSTARITRLITRDHITASLRDKVADRYGEDSNPAVFVNCPWCVSMWVAVLVVAAAAFVALTLAAPDIPQWAALLDWALICTACVLTLSYVTGFLAAFIDD